MQTKLWTWGCFAQGWQRMQDGYGWLVQDPMTSGTGSVTWHSCTGCRRGCPSRWGSRPRAPRRWPGSSARIRGSPGRRAAGSRRTPEWSTPLRRRARRSAWWHSQQGTVGRANERSRLSPWHCSQGSSAWRPWSGKLVRRWASASKRDFHPSGVVAGGALDARVAPVDVAVAGRAAAGQRLLEVHDVALAAGHLGVLPGEREPGALVDELHVPPPLGRVAGRALGVAGGVRPRGLHREVGLGGGGLSLRGGGEEQRGGCGEVDHGSYPRKAPLWKSAWHPWQSRDTGLYRLISRVPTLTTGWHFSQETLACLPVSA